MLYSSDLLQIESKLIKYIINYALSIIIICLLCLLLILSNIILNKIDKNFSYTQTILEDIDADIHELE